MATKPQAAIAPDDIAAVARLRTRELAQSRQRARVHPAQLHALRRRRRFPARPHRPHARHLEDPAAAARRRSARRASSTCRRSLPASWRTRPATSTRRTSSSSGCRPRRRSSGRSCRSAAGAWWRTASKSYGYKPDPQRRRDLHQVPQDPQRRRVRRLYAGHPQGAVVAHRHRPARCLRARPHHRRLSPGRPVRRGFPGRRQGAREARARRPPFDRGRDPPARGARRADPLAQGTEADGEELRPRHFGAGHQRARSRAVDLFRLPRRHQAAERRGDVGRAAVDLLGHLLRARPARRHARPSSRRRRSSTTW